MTFNYDRVLELLRDTQNERARSNPELCQLKVITPADEHDRESWRGCIPVFKLHGSVDWQKLTGGQVVVVKDPVFALSCRPNELAIATPGPSKAREASGFRSLWNLAESALEEADVVVFVGFRFPETDADAREFVLSALGQHRNEGRRKLRAHIVLGYDGPHTTRLESLIRFACTPTQTTEAQVIGRNLVVFSHSLFAQDFFTVATRAEL